MSTLDYNDLRIGTTFIFEGQPWEILEFAFVRMQQRKAVAQVKMKNLISGKVVSRSFHQNETFAEAEIVKEPVKFLYHHQGQYWFSPPHNPKERFFLTDEVVGSAGEFLKPDTEVTAIKFQDKTINIKLPIKVDLIVKEAPPAFRGDTAQGGSKPVVLETGAKINAPMFIEEGDLVRVNTETGQYVERVKIY